MYVSPSGRRSCGDVRPRCTQRTAASCMPWRKIPLQEMTSMPQRSVLGELCRSSFGCVRRVDAATRRVVREDRIVPLDYCCSCGYRVRSSLVHRCGSQRSSLLVGPACCLRVYASPSGRRSCGYVRPRCSCGYRRRSSAASVACVFLCNSLADDIVSHY